MQLGMSVTTPVSSSPVGGHGREDIDALPILVGVTALLLVAVVVVATLLVVLWFRWRNHRQPGDDEEEEPCSPSAIPRRDGLSSALSRRFQLPLSLLRMSHRESVNTEMSEQTVNRMSHRSSLSSLAKLDHQPQFLQPNPTYSVSNLSICGPTLEEEEVEEIAPYDVHFYGHLDSSMVTDFLQSYTSVYYDEPFVMMEPESPLEVAPLNVREIRQIGVGQFGQVVLAETVGLSLSGLKLGHGDRGVSNRVAVKKLKPDAEPEVEEAFQREIKIMSGLDHENIVRLLAVCSVKHPFIVMEYMENGDLNQYLRKHRNVTPVGTPSGKFQLSMPTLLYMAVQIASGMKYLASLRFVHRDLATRNCLVGQNYTVKISDFGMSRGLYSSHYFRLKGRAILPVRWMATECFYGKFSESTDIWAFGVAMWEIFVLAKKQPFDKMSNAEVIDDAMKGPRRQLLAKPACCPPEAYEVMLQCWVHEPEARANFDNVYGSLAELYSTYS